MPQPFASQYVTRRTFREASVLAGVDSPTVSGRETSMVEMCMSTLPSADPTPFAAGEPAVWVPEATPVHRWEEFDGVSLEGIPDVEAVADWVNALAAATEDVDADSEDWALAGRGVVLVAQDKEWAEVLLHRYTVAAGLTPVVVDADDIERLEPGALEQHAPAVCLLKPGRWLAADDPNESSEERAATSALRDRILALFSRFDVEQPVVFVTIADEVADLHESLRTVKRFDRFLHIPQRDDATWGAWLLACLGEEQFGPSIHGALSLAGRVFAREFETPRRRSLALLALARRVAARQRPLEFVDLIDLCARGFVEGALRAEEEERHCVAVHEAGHAVMVMVETGFRAVPEYSSIMPSLARGHDRCGGALGAPTVGAQLPGTPSGGA
jgi:hypothetical protein